MSFLNCIEFYLAIGILSFPFVRMTNAGKSDTGTFIFFFSLFMWPLMFCIVWYESSYMVKERKKKELIEQKIKWQETTEILEANRCGKTVQFGDGRHTWHHGSGIFNISASELETLVKQHSPTNKSLLEWLHNRDESVATPIDISKLPLVCSSSILEYALDQNLFIVFCSNCGTRIESVKKFTDSAKMGCWFLHYYCPNGHSLYSRVIGHMTPSRSGKNDKESSSEK